MDSMTEPIIRLKDEAGARFGSISRNYDEDRPLSAFVALMAAYSGTLVALAAFAASRRKLVGRIGGKDLALYSVATFRLARILAKDPITSPIRAPFTELQGTTGSSPAIKRKQGFEEGIAGHDNIRIVRSQTGDFTRAKGKEVMESFLKAEDGGKNICALYAHNDDMGLGAIEAIKAAGLKPGQDIKIVTVDAVKDGMTALANGEINFIVECNPLLGEQLMDLAEQVVAGEELPKRVQTEETTFTQEQAKQVLSERQY